MAPKRPTHLSGRKSVFRYHRSTRQSSSGALGSQKNPVHVLGRDTPIGWAVIQKVVDEFDKDQIEGVKNDIDTLLVFIGLFSAVLTAFVVVAVSLLQEDIPRATLTTLRSLSAQNANYTIVGSIIHSTSPAPASTPPFTPTPNAIRINVLWFSSLILSLATASFSLLVKQWLREYMKFVTSFPQGRLRVRTFRREGLETWKVLSIAACLPLLLQLALALFFVGLCCYTAELHASVRNTALPLVAGWAFVFFFVTVSPLFSAHCPYKTPALDSLVVAVRAIIRTRWTVVLETLEGRAHGIYGRASYGSFVEKTAHMVRQWADKHLTRLRNPERPYSEATAAAYEGGDLEIMAAADELQGNDEIVGTAMVDALQQSSAPPRGIIEFVLKILQHRIAWDGNFESAPQIIDCRMANARALDAVYSILQTYLPIDDILTSQHTNADSGQVESWTIALYLSLATHPHLTSKILPVLSPPLSSDPSLFVQVSLSAPTSQSLNLLLHLTVHSCRTAHLDLGHSTAQLNRVLKPYFIELRLAPEFEGDPDDAPWRAVLNWASLYPAVDFLSELLRVHTTTTDTSTGTGVGEWGEAHDNALGLLVMLMAVRPWDFTAGVEVWYALTSSAPDEAVQRVLRPLIKWYPKLLHAYMSYVGHQNDSEALSRISTALQALTTHSAHGLTRLSVLVACKTLVLTLYAVSDDIDSVSLTESWRGLFAAMAPLVRAAPALEAEAEAEAEAKEIRTCFRRLESIEAPRETFKPEDSLVPDDFYLALMQIYTPADPAACWRVRRLLEMSGEERDAETYLHRSDLDGVGGDEEQERRERAGMDLAVHEGILEDRDAAPLSVKPDV